MYIFFVIIDGISARSNIDDSDAIYHILSTPFTVFFFKFLPDKYGWYPIQELVQQWIGFHTRTNTYRLSLLVFDGIRGRGAGGGPNEG